MLSAIRPPAESAPACKEAAYSVCEMLVKAGPTLIEQAYDAILAAICDGRLAPGARLNQDDLAARMGISRQPVGQALSVLKAQSFVRDTGRRGLIVAPLEREFLHSVYELR